MSVVFIVLKDGKSVFGVFSNEKAAKAAADKMNKDIDKHTYTVEKHEVWEDF